MKAPHDFWGLLDALEKQMPPNQTKLESLLNLSFEKSVDWNQQPYFVGKDVRANPFGVPIASSSFHEAAGNVSGDLRIELATSDVSSGAVAERFPGGHWIPPPPPGFGGNDAGGAYVVDRTWGRLWFALGRGPGPVRAVTFELGAHGSPGV